MRKYFVGVEPEESRLIGADLVHIDLGEAGRGEADDRLHVTSGIRTAGDIRDRGFQRDRRDNAFEVLRTSEVGECRALERSLRPHAVQHRFRFVRALRPAHMQLAEAGLARATGGLEGFDRTRVLGPRA